MLTPDRALESFEEALEFLGDRGMLTRTPDTALPSLFEACHEEPYAPGSGGFGSWPATKYPWYFGLAERPDRLVGLLVPTFFGDLFGIPWLYEIALWLIAALSTVTVVQRILLVRRQALAPGAPQR